MKNKFSLWTEVANGGDGNDMTPENYQPPNIHMNLLFKSEGRSPIVCELQIQNSEVMHLSHIQHMLYEVRRAANIDALC